MYTGNSSIDYIVKSYSSVRTYTKYYFRTANGAPRIDFIGYFQTLTKNRLLGVYMHFTKWSLQLSIHVELYFSTLVTNHYGGLYYILIWLAYSLHLINHIHKLYI